ncbi:MAG: hypothetical protein IPF57_22085 [Gammaproteobacteria bacterium]|nr:hypothetical protein [Gammaproteobacteria bacterium]
MHNITLSLWPLWTKPDEARAAAVLHIQEIRKSLQAIEMENQRLERAGKWELIREKQ